jgi:hypothetical protein
MFFLPVRTFIFGVERLLDTLRGLQHASDRGMEIMAGRSSSANTKPEEIPGTPPPVLEASDVTQGAASGGTDTTIEETRHMDKVLNDDQLKLVRYKILFVKRDFEHAFPEEEALVADNIDASAFTAWKIAEFIQTLAKATTDVPPKWGTYPGGEYAKTGKLVGIPEDDKKYLRLFYEVLERYPREKFTYEEDHIEELREQTRVLRDISQRMPPPAAS